MPDPSSTSPDAPASWMQRSAAARREKLRPHGHFDDGFLHAAESQSVLASFLNELGGLARFTGQFFARCWRRPFEWRELLHQMDEVGTKSFLLVATVGLAIGTVMSMQSRGTMARFGAELFIPSMLVLSIVKEIGPVLTSVVLAGRVGAGIGAEIGSMRVSEQIDALEVGGLKPFHYLVVTRVLACVLMFPVLTALAVLLALCGGFLENTLAVGMDWRVFMQVGFRSLRFSDLIVDTLKTGVFGFLVGIVSCYLGYHVRGGTREVGQAAMQAVVLSSLLILLADVLIVAWSLVIFGDVSSGS